MKRIFVGLSLSILICMSIAAQDLRIFAQTHSSEEVENAIKSGADVNYKNYDGTTPLMFASHYCTDIEVINVLIRNGADVNSEDKNGRSAIFYAIENVLVNSLEITKILLENEVEVNSYDNRVLSPIMDAAIYDWTGKKIKLLLEYGAFINEYDNNGITPLMHASRSNSETAVNVLLENGADIFRKSNEGKTAFDYAKTNKKLQNTDILKKLAISNDTGSIQQYSYGSEQENYGTCKIERVWKEYDYTNVIITYKNNTNIPMAKTIKISVIAYDYLYNILDVKEYFLFADNNNPIPINYEDINKITFYIMGIYKVNARITTY